MEMFNSRRNQNMLKFVLNGTHYKSFYMAGRPRNFDEAEAIRKATEVFWKQGYEAASTEDLLKAMGIGKGSFYLHFRDGKKELFLRSLELFSSDAMTRFNERLSRSEDEIEFLRKYLLSLADLPADQKRKGCYLGNAIVEMSGIDPKTKAYAAMLLQKLERTFQKIIERAQQAGKIKNRTDSRVLAKYLINVRNGIHVTMRTDSTAELRGILHQSLQILK